MPWKNDNPPLYSVWRSMLCRCYNTKSKFYSYYGGRGIVVCPRWHNFKLFCADVAPRPLGLTLDRYPDKNGNYEPGNWRWATRKQQSRNTRVTRYVTIEGKEYMVAELSETTGLRSDTIIKRAALGVPYSRLIDHKKLSDMRTKEERKRAGQASSAARKARTHCRRGHPFSAKNTHITPQGTRLCRKCDALRARGLHKS